MKAKDLVGRQIKDILVWSKSEPGGLDHAQVFIKLDDGRTVAIPWGHNDENIEASIRDGSQSLFTDLNDIPTYHVNREGKSISDVIAAKTKRGNSIVGKIKRAFGIVEEIPNEYAVDRITYTENRLKYLKDQRIRDLLIFNDTDRRGFIELENGYILAETSAAPNGTGQAGLDYYECLSDLEELHGKEYTRLLSD